MKYDVVVVGGGPTGAMAAQYASRNGVSTLLIEKRQEIGSPVRCAEGVGKEALIKTGIKLDERWIANEVRGAKLVAPDGTTIDLSSEAAGNEVGYVLERKLFDRFLVCEAARSGADVLMKTAVKEVIKKEGRICGVRVVHFGKVEEIESKVLIACDGGESQVARFAGIDTSLKLKDVESCIQYLMVNVDYDMDFTHFYVGNCYSPGGYIWIFPKGNGVANVGIGVLGSKIGKRRGYAKELLDNFIKKHEEFKKAKIVEYISGVVPVSLPLEKTAMEGMLVAGDAARFTDSLTGGGIVNGMNSGKIAGEVAAEHVNNGTDLKVYEKRWKTCFQSSLLRDYIFKEKFVEMTDETLNLLADSLVDYNFSELGMSEILGAINSKHPEIMDEIEGLI